MKKIFFIVAFLFSAFVSFSQVIPKPNPTAVGIGYKRLLADSTIFIPTGGAEPRLGSNNINRRSAIYADTINKKLYVFYPNDSTWKESGTDTTSLSNRINARVKYTDTAAMLLAYYNKTAVDSKLGLKVNYTDTALMLTPYARTANVHNVPSGGTSGQLLSKNSNSDYDLVWIDNYADWTSVVKQYYKATEAITKGQAVYISGSNGTNALISKASNDSEAKSSKTIGLAAQTFSINGHGYVVTEGLLGNINTGTATAGDPVWLGTNGDLIFGLVNKPYAPAHLVYLGVVTKANSSTGEINIKPQNGFELKELHDVLAQSPSNNDGLFYNSGNSLWENKSIATALGYTPANAATYVPYTGATADVDLGNHNLSTNYTITSKSLVKSRQIIISGNDSTEGDLLGFKQYPSNFAGTYKTTAISAVNNNQLNIVFQHDTAVGGYLRYKSVAFKTDSLDINGPAKNYFFPNASGTLALKGDLNSYVNNAGYGLSKSGQTILADTSVLVNKAGEQVITGQKSFNGFTIFNYGSTYNNNTLLYASQFYASKGVAFSDTYSPAIFADAQAFAINRYDTISTMRIRRDNVPSGGSIEQTFSWRNTVSHNYIYPDASGTFALTSDLSAYVTLTTVQTISGNKTFSGSNTLFTGSATFNSALQATIGVILPMSGTVSNGSGTVGLGAYSGGLRTAFNGGYTSDLAFQMGANYVYTFPAASGTLALTSDITSAINGSSGRVPLFTSANAIGNSQIYDNGTTVGVGSPVSSQNKLVSVLSTDLNTAYAIMGWGTGTNTGGIYSTVKSGNIFLGQGEVGGVSGERFTVANTGAVTSASSIKGANFILSGGTGNTGLYYGHTDRVVLANYTAGGIDFETNGGVVNMTLFPNGNLGVGTSMTDDGTNKLQVAGSGKFSTSNANGFVLDLSNTAANTYGSIALRGNSRSGEIDFFTNTTINASIWSTSNNLTFATNGYTPALTLASTGAATFSSSVNIGGTGAAKLGVYGAVPANTYLLIDNAGSGINYYAANNYHEWQTAGSTRMILTSGGNVGIGTSSPFSIGSGYIGLSIAGDNTAGRGGYLSLMRGTTESARILSNSNETNIATIENTPLTFTTNSTERMRITSGGNLLVGTTTDVGYKAQFVGGGYYTMLINQSGGTGTYIPLAINHNVTSGSIRLINFSVGGSTDVGSITTNGSNTFYNIASDYRLKEDLKEYNGLQLISKIKTYDYQWKISKSRMYGVMAHELQEVIPYAVTGEKDGKEMQQVDYSKIVPILVKAVQELQQQITDLKTQINKQ